MSDTNDAGTESSGTQDVDAATNTGTATAGTQVEATQPTETSTAADSQTISDTSNTPPAQVPVGKQVPNPAKAGTDTADPWESNDNPYRKRHADTLSHATRLYQESQQRDRQIAEYQQRIQDFESKSKAQAEAAKLNPWNKGHPGHSQFRDLTSKADNYRQLVAKADTPEKKAMLQEMMSGQFYPEELQQLDASEKDRKNLIAEFSSDPRGFIASHVQDAVKAAITEYDSYQGARQQVQGIITDPKNAKLIESYAPDMHRMMDPNVPSRDKAFEFAAMKAELDALKAQVGQKVEQVATAEARQAARTGRPATSSKQQNESRNPRDVQREVAERLTKRGIPLGDARYESALADELLKTQHS